MKPPIMEYSKSGVDDSFSFKPLRPVQTSKTAPCQLNCPIGTSIRDWIAPIAQHEQLGLTTEAAYELAWNRIVDNNPFPAVMGRICPHPCESQCNRGDKDGSVAVSALERFLGDWALDQGLKLSHLHDNQNQESVGVVGAGPAGLSYAYQMARRGYEVDVYDWHPHAGGMLRYGVPEYRLPHVILDAEIQRITDLGVRLHTGVRIGSDVSLADIRERHPILFLGLGAQHGIPLNIPGENGPSVWVGTDFLARYNDGHALLPGQHLVVIGGGNTAIDVARTGRRSGADVTVLYRRELHEMPAIASEIQHAVEEGVRFKPLVTPSAVRRDEHGALLGLTVQRMRPGKVDDGGRHRPEPIPGDTYQLDSSSVVVAVSQDTDWAGLEEIRANAQIPDRKALDYHLTFGGDVLHLGIASQAIAHGKQAAEQACGEHYDELADAKLPDVKVDHYLPADRIAGHEAPAETRLRSPKLEVSDTITEDQFLAEVSRCLSCGSCLGCSQCWMYCNAGALTPRSDPGPGLYFDFDADICEGCGKCVELCPSGFLSYEPVC